MKKVLIISYYWPPSGGGGVQRWLKFVKYLPDFNWEPIVYSPENPEYPSIDYSLEKDISPDLIHLKQPIFEPYNFYKKFVGLKKDDRINTGFLSEKEKPKKAEGIAVWIRGNVFIPDARKFWIKPSIKFLSKYLKENHIDVIVTTGPPHSMHLIGLGLKKKFGVKWVADFRDPWTKIDFYNELKLSSWANKKHHRLEQKVVNNADGIIAIGEGVFKNLPPIPSSTKKCTIPNGFDEEDFVGKERRKHEHFVISHFGSINKTRNPEGIWNALTKINAERPEIGKQIKVKLYGKVDFQVGQGIVSLIDNGQVEIIDYLPHDKMIDELLYSDLLLLMINRVDNADRITTGKIFEYIGSGQDIIGLGPVKGDAASILEKSDAGKMYDWDDVDGIKGHILQSIKNSKALSSPLTKERLKYSRKELTADLVSFLTSI
jgi:hypothetical protein